MRKGTTVLVAIFFAGLLSGNLRAAARWNLEFKPVKLSRISIRTGNRWNAYWYLLYRVTNKTEEAVPLFLSIKAFTDAGPRPFVQGFYPRVVQAVEQREHKDLLDIRQMRGEIAPGETKEAVAVFGSLPESTDLLTVQVLGLWDRIVRESGKVFVEDRALLLAFYRPGDEYFPQYDRIRLVKSEWKVLERRPLK